MSQSRLKYAASMYMYMYMYEYAHNAKSSQNAPQRDICAFVHAELRVRLQTVQNQYKTRWNFIQKRERLGSYTGDVTVWYLAMYCFVCWRRCASRSIDSLINDVARFTSSSGTSLTRRAVTSSCTQQVSGDDAAAVSSWRSASCCNQQYILRTWIDIQVQSYMYVQSCKYYKSNL